MFRIRRLRTRQLRMRRRQIIVYGISLLVLLAVSILFLFSELSKWRELRIRDIEVVGNVVIETREVEALTRDVLSGWYWYLFARPNIIIYPRRELEREILKQFPRVASVDVDTTGRNSIRIETVERESHGLWCSDYGTEGEACFFLDKTGFVFAEAPTFSVSSFFVYRGALLGEGPSPIGKRFLEREAFSELQFFIETLREQLNVETNMLVTETSDQYEIFLPEEEGGAFQPRIVFNPLDGYSVVLANIQAILSSTEFRAEAGDRLLQIDYIDLRFGNKVFYKLEREMDKSELLFESSDRFASFAYRLERDRDVGSSLFESNNQLESSVYPVESNTDTVLEEVTDDE